VLRALQIKSVQLLTNNPEKIAAVLAGGIKIAERISADVPVSPHSARYVSTKRTRLGHLFGSGSTIHDDGAHRLRLRNSNL
jgi:GTP cyclohydrolase II